MMDLIKRFNQNILADIVDQQGNSLVGMAAMTGSWQMLELLLERGMSPDQPNYEGNTPLHYAVNANYLKIIDLLIFYGADEKAENKNGDSPWELMR